MIEDVLEYKRQVKCQNCDHWVVTPESTEWNKNGVCEYLSHTPEITFDPPLTETNIKMITSSDFYCAGWEPGPSLKD